MGARGPAPKPTAIKKMEGTYRKDRAARNEPQPKVMIPKPPKWLAGEGLKEYRKLARIMAQTRVLTEADGMALAAHCQQYQVYLDANRMIQEAGMVLRGNQGGYYPNPYVGIANNALKNMMAFMREFGMTPASRTRISAQPEPEEDSIRSMLEHAAIGVDVVEDA